MKDDHIAILLEEIKSQNQALTEGQQELSTLPATVKQLANDVAEIKDDIHTIKAAVTDTNKQVHNHENRFTRLEHKIA
jgi:septal ring factor EnvC (AmiA/AmiB activator)